MPAPSSRHRLHQYTVHALAASGYVLLAALLTWPTAAHLATHIAVGDGGRFAYSGFNDAIQHTWNFWWTQHALSNGRLPFATELLFYPEGAPLYRHTLGPALTLPLAPVTALAGPVAAYNLALLLGVASTGYAVFLLAGYVAGGDACAWIAGALVAAGPFLAMKLQVSHLNLLYVGWLALLLFAALRLADTRKERYALLGAVSLAGVAYTDWYLALCAGCLLLTWVAASLWRTPHPLGLARSYALMGLLAFLGIAPLILGLWTTRERYAPFSAAQRASWQIGVEGYSADAVGLFFPSLLQPHWRGVAEALTAPLVASVPVIEGWYIAAGWTLLGLAAVGVWQHGHAQWRLLIVAAVGWLFSLGPELRLFGVHTGIPMPYALLQQLPLLEGGRRPNLFALICILVAAVFAAQGLRWLLEWSGRWRHVLLAGVVLAAGLELWPPPRQPVVIAAPALYATIADRPGPVVDVPVGSDIEARTLLHQMAHGQPILRGYLSRAPDYPTLEHNPLVRALALLEPLPARDIVALDSAALAAMQCFYRFRHVVVERPLVASEHQGWLAPLMARLGAPDPWYDDGRFAAYELPVPAPPCPAFSYLGAGWHGLEGTGERVWRWMDKRSEIWIVNPVPGPVLLTLRAEGYGPPAAGQTTTLHLDHAKKRVATVPIARSARVYHIVLNPPPGATRLDLVSEQVGSDKGGRLISISVGAIRVRALGAPPAFPPDASSSTARLPVTWSWHRHDASRCAIPNPKSTIPNPPGLHLHRRT